MKEKEDFEISEERKTEEHILKVLRRQSSLKQQDIAHALGISLRVYRKIEKGQKHMNLNQLCGIAGLYKIRKSLLLGNGHSALETPGPEKILLLLKLKKAEETLTLIRRKIEKFQ